MIAPYRPAEIPLHELFPGQSAYVAQVVGRADDVHRLEEFGLRRGTKVEMFRRGSPCILRIAGSKVCLRADEGLQILVTPVD